MGRRRRIIRGSRDKYSVEHKAGNVATEATTGDGGVVIVPATSTEGMRKVKHVVVNLAANDVAGTFDRSCSGPSCMSLRVLLLTLSR